MLFATLAAGGSAGCLLLGRQYDAASWRELCRVDHAIAAPVDAEGFYSTATCAAACPVFTPETLERCYPVAADIPVLPERIVDCSYVDSQDERRAVPRAAIEAAHVDSLPRPTYREHGVDQESCQHFCAAKDKRLNFCNVEADLPPTPAGDFVVCAYHRPTGSNLVIQ